MAEKIPLHGKFSPVRKETVLENYRGKKGSVLVIAPHPDDDVLGAGGSMALYSDQGKAVFSIYLTDGRGSPRRDEDLKVPDEEFAARRQTEAVSALAKVGATGAFFLGHRSGELTGGNGKIAAAEISAVCRFLLPEEIFLPAPYDSHPTHQRCTHLAIGALRPIHPRPILLGYSFWGCFRGGKERVFRDITPVIRRKVDAVLAHASQIACKNYQQGILGKNNYDAVFWETHEPQKASFAEIFLEMTELLEHEALSLEEFMRQDFELFLKDFRSASADPPKDPE